MSTLSSAVLKPVLLAAACARRRVAVTLTVVPAWPAWLPSRATAWLCDWSTAAEMATPLPPLVATRLPVIRAYRSYTSARSAAGHW